MLGPLGYLDPGTGSLFLQLLLGGVAGLLVVLKLSWRRLLSVFGVRAGGPDAQEKAGTGDESRADVES